MRQKLTSFATLAIALALMLPLSTGCSVFKPDDKAVVAQAAQVHGQLQPAVIQDAQVQAYMDQIGARIVQAAAEYNKDPKKGEDKRNKEDNAWLYSGDIKFHLVNSKTLNAFTTGGQHVYIYNELFQQAKSEDELAAVMSHEFAHIYCRHVAKGMTRQTEASAVTTVSSLAATAVGGSGWAGTAANLGATGIGAATQFLNMGFTRGDEDEADKYGFSFYIRAGWDPDRFADFFKRMIELGYDTTPEIASDHPKLSSRVEKTSERVAKVDANVQASRRKAPIASPQQFQQIQQRAVAVSKNTPDDKSLAAAQLMLAAFPSCVAPQDLPDQQRAKQRIINAGGSR